MKLFGIDFNRNYTEEEVEEICSRIRERGDAILLFIIRSTFIAVVAMALVFFFISLIT
jgi:hypothetical protein